MLKILITISIIAIIAIGYMYSQNYIQFEGNLRIVLPTKPTIMKSVEKFEPSNVEPSIIDTGLVASVKLLTPSTKTSKVLETRLFDDVIKATQTFSPIIMPFITFYFYKKKKKIDFQKA